MTAKDLALHHAACFRLGSHPTLEAAIEMAVEQALDTMDDKYLASELRRVENDRDGWMRKAVARALRMAELQDDNDIIETKLAKAEGQA